MTEETKNQEPFKITSNPDGSKSITFAVAGVDTSKYSGEKKALGTGSVVNRYDPTYRFNSYPFWTSNNTPYTTAIQLPTEPHEKIALATELYFKEPIVGTVIDMMVDFSAGGFENECDDPDVKKLFDEWCKKIKMQDTINAIFLDYYRCGNATIYRDSRNAMVKRKQNKSKAKKVTDKQYKFPAGYTVLNPMMVEIEGSLMFNQELVYVKLSNELQMIINATNPTPEEKFIKDSIPPEIIKGLKDGERIALDPKLVSRITRKRQPYERYASPFTERIFESCLYKQKLREMDLSTIEGLVNQLVTVTTGNDEFPADDDRLRALAELFATPEKAFTVFWDHTLNVKFHKPEGAEILDQNKYQQVNEDMLMGLGFPRSLIDGDGNFSVAWVAVLSVIQRLENARNQVKHWLEAEYEQIAEANDFDEYPKVRFDKMSLRQEDFVRQVILSMYDRGLLSTETTLTEIGYDIDTELSRKKREEDDAEYFLPPTLPFSGDTIPSSAQPDGKRAGPSNQGREPGSGGNYPKRKQSPEMKGTTPKPKKPATASASYGTDAEDYEKELRSYYQNVQDEVVEAVKNSTADKERKHNAILASLYALAVLMRQVGTKFLTDSFNTSYNSITSHVDHEIVHQTSKALKDWNNHYVDKFVSDLKASLLEKEDASIDEIEQVFKSNSYRIKMFADNGTFKAYRQGEISAERANGKNVATWVSAHDDRVCNYCRGLDGKKFDIASIPDSHPNCRCGLHFT